MKTLIIALLLIPAMAAADVSALFGGWSYHMDRTVDWNEEHRMTGIAYKRVSAMAFTNSHGAESYGVGYEHPLSGNFSAYAAVLTGYDGWDYGRPAGGVRYRWSVGRLSVVGTTAVEVSIVHLEWRF